MAASEAETATTTEWDPAVLSAAVSSEGGFTGYEEGITPTIYGFEEKRCSKFALLS